MTELDKNLKELDALTAGYRSATLPHFINGKEDAGRSGEVFENLTPIDNSVIGSIASGNADDIDAACKVADEAFQEWKSLPGKGRY